MEINYCRERSKLKLWRLCREHWPSTRLRGGETYYAENVGYRVVWVRCEFLSRTKNYFDDIIGVTPSIKCLKKTITPHGITFYHIINKYPKT